MTLVVAEIPSKIWELKPTFCLPVDRSGQTVAEYLDSRGIVWKFGACKSDVLICKGGTGAVTLRRLADEIKKRLICRCPIVTLLGEPRELAPAEYLFARRETTLAVAPGDNLRRLYFGNVWLDPRLDDWRKRLDRICWIGRPTTDRIRIARQLNAWKIPLDIYSRAPWPVPNWIGFAENEVDVSRKYKYRLVCENSFSYGYHSEKLFNSIRCGCVTFYKGDTTVDLSHASGTFFPLERVKIENRKDMAPLALSSVEKFMFSKAWEVYSLKGFYDRIIDQALLQLKRKYESC